MPMKESNANRSTSRTKSPTVKPGSRGQETMTSGSSDLLRGLSDRKLVDVFIKGSGAGSSGRRLMRDSNREIERRQRAGTYSR